MSEVKFAKYRQYLEQRQLVNSSVMALLVGSQLASHTLQLTHGSDRPLREIFPSVPHIDRFNLKSEHARNLLVEAESHLSTMAIPYILTIHESLFETFEEMLTSSGITVPRTHRTTSPVWVMRKYWDQIGTPLDQPSWQLLGFLIEMRHDITHRAGIVGEKLVEKANALGVEAESIYARMTKKSLPSYSIGQKHSLNHADIVACLAVVKFLATEGNVHMQSCYPRNSWVRSMVDDMEATQGLRGNPAQRLRKSSSFARRFYGPLDLTTQEIEAELKSRQ